MHAIGQLLLVGETATEIFKSHHRIYLDQQVLYLLAHLLFSDNNDLEREPLQKPVLVKLNQPITEKKRKRLLSNHKETEI